MDDGEGGLSFDFEGGLDTGPSHPTASVPVIKSSGDANTASAIAANANYPSAVPTPATQAAEGMVGAGRRSFRQTVCRHWLRSLCMKGDACGFLHQYDKSRMPVCRFFRLYGECREQDCVYKHTNEDIKECNMYKLGFCPNGPDCRYRHAKLPGPPPPVEEVLRKIQQSSYNYGNRFFQNRNTNYAQQTEKSQFPQGPNDANQVAKGSTTESGNLIHPPQQGQLSQQPGSQGQTQNLPNSQQNQASRNATPLPQGTSRYFVVKSCNKENLELSVQQGVWATQRSNEAKLNEAFESVDNVILIFSVNKTRHFQLGELSFNKTRHLRNPYNENLQVKAVSLAAESKREEEKAKGVNRESGSENPDIVPFEDDEEEEEDESEEEDENLGQVFGAQGRGRGRGRGIMWPPHMPLARGARAFHGIRGFPPNLVAGDGFSYGPMNHDGFPMPDPFGMAPRSLSPYGPRFSGDFAGPTSGMMFPVRPSGGFGMMMGPGRPPFMGGMGVGPTPAARASRPLGIAPFYMPPPTQPSQNSNRAKRDQKAPNSDRNEGSAHAKDQEMAGSAGDEGQYQQRGKAQQDHYSAGNSLRSDESESEDEAPRRSRHGEGKKQRRSLETDANAVSDGLV
ncbi:UNVERIFIED_CONTAM: cleavage and polyadenylation specificity factor 30 [Sesamum calycinum]|uniref:Cleavage and polyadenylation specificity factor 30 n=1 Tax=Sesamum calycinum TaxID=2727403 RepID=A0AAW2Q7P6_9LAMI